MPAREGVKARARAGARRPRAAAKACLARARHSAVAHPHRGSRGPPGRDLRRGRGRHRAHRPGARPHRHRVDRPRDRGRHPGLGARRLRADVRVDAHPRRGLARDPASRAAGHPRAPARHGPGHHDRCADVGHTAGAAGRALACADPGAARGTGARPLPGGARHPGLPDPPEHPRPGDPRLSDVRHRRRLPRWRGRARVRHHRPGRAARAGGRGAGADPPRQAVALRARAAGAGRGAARHGQGAQRAGGLPQPAPGRVGDHRPAHGLGRPVALVLRPAGGAGPGRARRYRRRRRGAVRGERHGRAAGHALEPGRLPGRVRGGAVRLRRRPHRRPRLRDHPPGRGDRDRAGDGHARPGGGGHDLEGPAPARAARDAGGAARGREQAPLLARRRQGRGVLLVRDRRIATARVTPRPAPALSPRAGSRSCPRRSA